MTDPIVNDDNFLSLLEFGYDILEEVKDVDADLKPPCSTSIRTITKKTLDHLATGFYLRKGTDIALPKRGVQHFVDYPSLYSVMRTAFDSYATLHYIFVNPKSEDERRLRMDAWKLDAYKDRQPIRTHNEEDAAKKLAESKTIEELRESIMANPAYLSFDKEVQKRLRSGNWKGKTSYGDMGKLAGFDEGEDKDAITIAQTYGFFSGYAHTSYLAVMQLAQMDDTNRERFASSAMAFGHIVMSHMINDLLTVFPEASHLLDDARYIRKILIDHRKVYPSKPDPKVSL